MVKLSKRGKRAGGRELRSVAKGATALISERINYLVREYLMIMLEQRGNKVFLVLNHHMFLNWKKEAVRCLVGFGQIPKGHFSSDGKHFYITDPL